MRCCRFTWVTSDLFRWCLNFWCWAPVLFWCLTSELLSSSTAFPRRKWTASRWVRTGTNLSSSIWRSTRTEICWPRRETFSSAAITSSKSWPKWCCWFRTPPAGNLLSTSERSESFETPSLLSVEVHTCLTSVTHSVWSEVPFSFQKQRFMWSPCSVLTFFGCCSTPLFKIQTLSDTVYLEIWACV